MNVNKIAEAIKKWGDWQGTANYGGQVEFFRRDYDYKIVLNADGWELAAVLDNRTEEIVCGGTVEEVEIAMAVLDATKPLARRKPILRDDCDCRFSGDRADASECRMHGGAR